MNKILTVASSEFQTAVRSKGFLIGIMIMPLLLVASVGIQKLAGDRIDRDQRRVAVIDHTARLYPLLEQSALAWNARQVGADGTITGPRYLVERAQPPAGGSLDALSPVSSSSMQARYSPISARSVRRSAVRPNGSSAVPRSRFMRASTCIAPRIQGPKAIFFGLPSAPRRESRGGAMWCISL